MVRFFQLTLRTSDVDAARDFYSAFLEGAQLHIVQLHEQAVARGARPHWLGYLDVGDVERAAAAFVERGATPLAPKWVNPEGLEAAVMRDPGGAIVALAKPPPSRSELGPEVAWYGLNTADVERARANYGELFGWEFKPPLELGSLGVFHPFAWERGGDAVGFMADIQDRPAIHPHWLFQLRVASLTRAQELVRAAGGRVAAEFGAPGEAQIAVCEDPQGAAFALRQEA